MSDHASWCRRVGISLNAGLDIVSTLRREAVGLDDKIQPSPVKRMGTGRKPNQKPNQQNAPKEFKMEVWKSVADDVAKGSSLHEAMKNRKEDFPRLLIAMVGVGEESGHLGEMMLELAGYYDMTLKMKREFWSSIMGPLFQLFVAIVFIGILILVLGVLNDVAGKKIDPFGLGLFGIRGFFEYLGIISIPGIIIYGIYRFFRSNFQRGSNWLHYKLDAIPKIHEYFRISAMARLTMSLDLTLRTGMPIQRALKLSFDAAAYAPVTDLLPEVLKNVALGKTLCESFPVTEFFNEHFLLFLRAGEESGNIPAAMKKVSVDYFDHAKSELKFLSTVTYFIVYTIVAVILIILILRGYHNVYGI